MDCVVDDVIVADDDVVVVVVAVGVWFCEGGGEVGRVRPGGDRAGLRPLLMNCVNEQSEGRSVREKEIEGHTKRRGGGGGGGKCRGMEESMGRIVETAFYMFLQ